MKTYQDLRKLGEDEFNRMAFVRSCIHEHKASELWHMADVANDYYMQRNRTIMQFQKLLYTITGRAVPDNYSSNWKMRSGDFHRIVVQEVEYSLGNGVVWQDPEKGAMLGKNFDTILQKAAKEAIVGGVAFLFYNLDHVELFSVREFAPLYDEENGALMAGIRFWQVSPDKPLRATLYEVDGYTDYIWRKDKGEILHDKRPYILYIKTSAADGTEIYDFANYPDFPIVPFWGNPEHQSAIDGLREQIDCYDLIKSGFANDVDDASLIYWTVQNNGGMDDLSLVKFVERMKTVHAVNLEHGSSAEAHTIDLPYQSKEALLERLHKDLYRDAMALDIENLASGAVTATQIQAGYEPLNQKCDHFEYCVLEAIEGLLRLAGIEDETPTFTRSKVVNAQEEIQTLVSAAEFLPADYITERILNILGDGDRAEQIRAQMTADEMDKLKLEEEPEEEEQPEEPEEPQEGQE